MTYKTKAAPGGHPNAAKHAANEVYRDEVRR
jgi:hypothetical protein